MSEDASETVNSESIISDSEEELDGEFDWIERDSEFEATDDSFIPDSSESSEDFASELSEEENNDGDNLEDNLLDRYYKSNPLFVCG